MKTIVIGAGPAGMMAAYQSAINGNEALLIEKNNSLGKKLLLTGNGRCNVTNNADYSSFLTKVNSNPKFLYSALYTFSPQDMIDFLENNGCKTKEEDNHRIFPISNKASSILDLFNELLITNNVDIHTNESVISLIIQENTCIGVKTNKQSYYADKIIVCTGGLSIPSTGSTGDGYTLANNCGHTIIECKPALVGLNIKEEYLKQLKGLTLKNVELKLNKKKYIGDILFTHFGISGPMILNISSQIDPGTLYLDLLPDIIDLDKHLQELFIKYSNKQVQTVLSLLLPNRFISALLNEYHIEDKPVHSIKKEERILLSNIIKHFPITIISTRDFNEAMLTKGGISVKEINPNTMESKYIKQLYFAGEIIDVDAYTGGYNLQIAWSTGYLAGSN